MKFNENQIIISLEDKPAIFVLGIDRDPFSITSFNNEDCHNFIQSSRLKLFNEKFSNLSHKLIHPFRKAKGVLFDLGYSTTQVIVTKFNLNCNFQRLILPNTAFLI